MERRLWEVERYVHVDVLWQVLALVSCNFCLHDHPVISCFTKDKKGTELDDSDALRIKKTAKVKAAGQVMGGSTAEFLNPMNPADHDDRDT